MKWLSLSFVGILTGCVGYQAGPTNGVIAGARTVRVSFFRNETLEPRLVVAVNRAVKRNLQQDGTFELETHGNADLLVTGEVILDRTITGSSIVRVGSDLSAGQRQVVPLIADQLARQATDLIVDGDWPEAPAVP